ncbi:MAG: efflux RND transporter periplasmic adaptor subunit [Bacteroidia bacterium]
MNKTIAILTISLIAGIITSCGEDKSTLSELKAKQAELITELEKVKQEIEKLDSNKASNGTLVTVKKLIPEFFKTYINVQGKVDAEESVSISSEIPGTITKIHVKTGDFVHKGEVLAETDARSIQQSMADLETAIELSNQLYDKQKALWEQKIGTEIQYLQAKTQKESLEKKKAALAEQLRMSKIVSPIDGTIDAVDIKLGQLVAPGMPAIRVVNFNNLKIKAEIAESYISKVHRGDKVIVSFPDTGDTLSSTIHYSARSINPVSRTFNVELLLDNKKEYYPNQIVVLKINDYVSQKPTISISNKLIQKDFSGKHYAFIASNNKVQRKNIQLGKEYNGYTEITSGLQDNDLLIVEGSESISEGSVIQTK